MNKLLTLLAVLLLVCCKVPETKEPIFTGDLNPKQPSYSNTENPNALRVMIELSSNGELAIKKIDLARGKINNQLSNAAILGAHSKIESLGFQYELEYESGGVFTGHFFIPTVSYTSYYEENDSFVTHDAVNNNRYIDSFLIPLEAAKSLKVISTKPLDIENGKINFSDKVIQIELESFLKDMEKRNTEVLRKTSYFNTKNSQEKKIDK